MPSVLVAERGVQTSHTAGHRCIDRMLCLESHVTFKLLLINLENVLEEPDDPVGRRWVPAESLDAEVRVSSMYHSCSRRVFVTDQTWQSMQKERSRWPQAKDRERISSVMSDLVYSWHVSQTMSDRLTDAINSTSTSSHALPCGSFPRIDR